MLTPLQRQAVEEFNQARRHMWNLGVSECDVCGVATNDCEYLRNPDEWDDKRYICKECRKENNEGEFELEHW